MSQANAYSRILAPSCWNVWSGQPSGGQATIDPPNHPGAAHYLIHSYNSAPLADLGLSAAFQRVSERIPLISRLFEHALALLVAIIW